MEVKVNVEFRFYEEINDYLPPDWRKVMISRTVRAGKAVGEVIAGFGVPVKEVDLILANGVSVCIDYPLCNGDRIAVYPVFESFDIGTVSLLAGRPLRHIGFVVDRDLEKLAAALHDVGYDVLQTANRKQVSALVNEKGRVLLTRKPEWFEKERVTRGYCVRGNTLDEQLREVLERFNLDRSRLK